MNIIPETDWKKLRAMQDEKIDMACGRILAATEAIVNQRQGNEHQAYLKLWDEVDKGNEMIAELFDNMTRSKAIFKLMAWKREGFLSDDELALFSEQTQQKLSRL